MAYKISSFKNQARLRRIVARHLGDFNDDITIEELRENLQKKSKFLQDKCAIEKDKTKRNDLISELTVVNDHLRQLKPLQKFDRTFANFICDVIKKEVTKAQWEIWVKKATQDMNESREKIEKTLSEETTTQSE